MLLVFALSIHSVFEGFSVGLVEDVKELLQVIFRLILNMYFFFNFLDFCGSYNSQNGHWLFIRDSFSTIKDEIVFNNFMLYCICRTNFNWWVKWLSHYGLDE